MLSRLATAEKEHQARVRTINLYADRKVICVCNATYPLRRESCFWHFSSTFAHSEDSFSASDTPVVSRAFSDCYRWRVCSRRLLEGDRSRLARSARGIALGLITRNVHFWRVAPPVFVSSDTGTFVTRVHAHPLRMRSRCRFGSGDGKFDSAPPSVFPRTSYVYAFSCSTNSQSAFSRRR